MKPIAAIATMTIEVTRPFGDDFELRRWVPPEDFSAGEFRDRQDPTLWAAIHKSTRDPGRWQVTWFDAAGAIGDTTRVALKDALRELPPGVWEHVAS